MNTVKWQQYHDILDHPLTAKNWSIPLFRNPNQSIFIASFGNRAKQHLAALIAVAIWHFHILLQLFKKTIRLIWNSNDQNDQNSQRSVTDMLCTWALCRTVFSRLELEICCSVRFNRYHVPAWKDSISVRCLNKFEIETFANTPILDVKRKPFRRKHQSK